MVVLRGTKKVLRYLSAPVDTPGESTTALGDWYANRIVVGRQPLLLLVSANSLLAALEVARDVRGFPGRLTAVAAERLQRLGACDALVQAEVAAMESVAVAKTASRSVLGFMNDFAKAVPFYWSGQNWDVTKLYEVEKLLWETPCWSSRRLSEGFFPDRKTKELLEEKWSVGRRSDVVS